MNNPVFYFHTFDLQKGLQVVGMLQWDVPDIIRDAAEILLANRMAWNIGWRADPEEPDRLIMVRKIRKSYMDMYRFEMRMNPNSLNLLYDTLLEKQPNRDMPFAERVTAFVTDGASEEES